MNAFFKDRDQLLKFFWHGAVGEAPEGLGQFKAKHEHFALNLGWFLDQSLHFAVGNEQASSGIVTNFDERMLLDEHIFPQAFLDLQGIDFVDAESAEVSKVDGLPHTLMQHCAQQEGFIGENMSLVAAVFRIFLANGNKSLTARELAEKSGKSATIILRTFSSSSVFKGIRPILK